VSSKKRKTARSGPFDSLRDLKKKLAVKGAEPPEGGARQLAPPSLSSRARSEPEDDSLLFHRLFAGVQPLDRTRAARLPRQPVDRSAAAEAEARRAAEAARVEAGAVEEHLRELVEGGSRFEVADDGHHVEGRRIDVPMSAVRKLRRGLLPIDARLDLHGMSVAEARGELESFLRSTRARGERCVLVIHGKGEHSPGGMGVLRGEISAWLSQGPASVNVASFATARASDGGEGAIYVLLRR
jgi:DNA-nicking Smr family endonuclease